MRHLPRGYLDWRLRVKPFFAFFRKSAAIVDLARRFVV